MMMESGRPYQLQSDLEHAAELQERQQNAAQAVLDQIGTLLNQADGALTDLERQDVLGSAIVRGAQELADAISNLADNIDRQTDEERRSIAQACLEDARNTLLLQEDSTATAAIQRRPLTSQELQEFSTLSEDEVMNAIQAAASLLRDVEFTLRAIEQDEADELADVALTVAHLFISSLQSVHASITPQDLTGSQQRRTKSSSVEIEMLDGDEDETESGQNDDAKEKKKKKVDKVRVLWPPLGPAVVSAFDWGKEAASQKPLLAVALGITLWPAAVITTVIGAPVVLFDGFIQDLYSNFEDAPLIQGLERSAAQIYHTGRLSILCGKLMGRQTLRVVSRQVDRHGGVGKIAQDLTGMVVDRVTHPIETIGMAWNGLVWGVESARGAIEHFTDQEGSDTTQRLQQ